MRISEVMGITKSQLELDFYDYEIEKDTLLFFDPYYISKKEDAFLSECNEYINSFFNQFLLLLKRDEVRAFRLFSHLGEVNEICLGMSSGKPSGRGIGYIDAKKIFFAIKNSKAVQDEVLEHLEDIRLFVEGVDKDKISDMVANIIKYPLIKYTIEQCRLYDVPMRTVETGFYWNKNRWERSHEDMIVFRNKRYLLFPRNILTASNSYCADQYYRMYVLEHLKVENLEKDTHLVRRRYDRQGLLVSRRVCKKDIDEEIRSSEPTNRVTKDWIARFTKENPGVLEKYRVEAIEDIIVQDTVLSDEEYDRLVDSLICELKDIPEGPESATKYHHLISGILELLFYPSIGHPRIEQEIHDGRKRIDILFDNNADDGFFFKLHVMHRIPDSMIMVECKNYSKDINNPELDQMAGRFSPKRGRFGIICCRSLDNSALFVARERDTVRDDRGFIIHLTDDDIITMLNFIKTDNEGQKKIDEYMNSKITEILL